MAEAQDRLKQKYNMSVYATEFGAHGRQHTADELVILKYKKFSELPLAVMLADKAKSCLDSWLALNDLDTYQACVLECLRSLFALINTQAVSKSHYTMQYQYNKALVTPAERIDKRLFAKTSVATKLAPPKVERPVEVPEEKTAPAAVAGTSLLKPSAIRAELLRGNGYITASCFAPEKVSVYQSAYK